MCRLLFTEQGIKLSWILDSELLGTEGWGEGPRCPVSGRRLSDDSRTFPEAGAAELQQLLELMLQGFPPRPCLAPGARPMLCGPGSGWAWQLPSTWGGRTSRRVGHIGWVILVTFLGRRLGGPTRVTMLCQYLLCGLGRVHCPVWFSFHFSL